MTNQHKGNSNVIQRVIRVITPPCVRHRHIRICRRPGGMSDRSQLVENIIGLIIASMGALIAEPLCNTAGAG